MYQAENGEFLHDAFKRICAVGKTLGEHGLKAVTGRVPVRQVPRVRAARTRQGRLQADLG